MNAGQRIKFIIKFDELIKKAPIEVQKRYASVIMFKKSFYLLGKLIPVFNEGVIDSLPVDLKMEYDKLLKDFHAKRL